MQGRALGVQGAKHPGQAPNVQGGCEACCFEGCRVRRAACEMLRKGLVYSRKLCAGDESKGWRCVVAASLMPMNAKSVAWLCGSAHFSAACSPHPILHPCPRPAGSAPQRSSQTV